MCGGPPRCGEAHLPATAYPPSYVETRAVARLGSLPFGGAERLVRSPSPDYDHPWEDPHLPARSASMRYISWLVFALLALPRPEAAHGQPPGNPPPAKVVPAPAIADADALAPDEQTLRTAGLRV